MYASAMTVLERRDGEGGSYLDLAQCIVDHGARDSIVTDLEQLFRRVLFNVLVGNRDDHMRNHGFVREASGWRLAPAFDVNPSLSKLEHSLTLDGKFTQPSTGAVMATAELYRLTASRARSIFDEVRSALSGWREVAQQHGLGRLEVQRMERVIQA